MTTPQEDFVAGAEAKAAELGERHGLSMLIAGLEHMLKAQGRDFTFQEIQGFVHNHHTLGFMDQAVQPETMDLPALAHAFDLMFTGQAEASWELRQVLEGRATSGVCYSCNVSTKWIEDQIANEIKARKIRRGTKKYAEFVEANAQKIYAAVVESAKQTAKKMQDAALRRLEQINKDRDKFLVNHGYQQRQLAFRKTLLEVTGTEPDPRSEAGVASRQALYDRALAAYDSNIDYLQNEVARLEADTDTAAREAMSRNEVLSPFLKAAVGI